MILSILIDDYPVICDHVDGFQCQAEYECRKSKTFFNATQN